jgi:hypothetical protein
VLIAGVEPRLNQSASSLLSLIDDIPLREEIQRALTEEHEAMLSERRETAEAQIVRAVSDAFTEAAGATVTVRDIADRFNREHGAEYGGPRSNRWVGHILRTRLHLTTRKSDGVYVVPATERTKVAGLAARMGV